MTVTVTDTIPAGIKTIAAPTVAAGAGNTGWTFTITSTTGPSTITATSTVTILAAATVLPTIVITV